MFRNLDLSIVVAVYNEDPRNLTLLLERIDKTITPVQLTYEVIFVNDGSKAPTTEALRKLAGEFNYVKLIELSRNFGQQAAISAGIDHADGDAIVNLDSDLQDPPELIPEMINKWKSGYDVVYAQRSTRQDRPAKRLSAYIFYRILGSISSVQIPWDTGDFRLIDRRVADALRSLPEKVRFLRGLIPWLGFKQIGIPINRDARALGESAYTLKKLLSLAFDGLLAFSVLPLYFILLAGIIELLLALGALVGYTTFGAHTHIFNPALIGIILLFVGGIQILSIGIVAVYLSKVVEEVRGRPTYIVAEKRGLIYSKDVTPDESEVLHTRAKTEKFYSQK